MTSPTTIEAGEGKRTRCHSPFNCISRQQAKRKPNPKVKNEIPSHRVRNRRLSVPQCTPSQSKRLRDSRRGTFIAPSKESLKLMRRIGALGMEDPVFGTYNRGPSHPSQIFDDMSLGDVPTDMRSLMSVASDPTAEMDNGVDLSLFHSSLGDLHRSLSGFSHAELLGPLHASASEQSGTRSKRGNTQHTKDTYVSAKVDPWGMNYKRNRQSLAHEDATDTSETRSVTTTLSLTLQDLGLRPPSPRSPVGRYNDKGARYPSVAKEKLSALPASPLSKHQNVVGSNTQNFKNAQYWNSPYRSQTDSVVSTFSFPVDETETGFGAICALDESQTTLTLSSKHTTGDAGAVRSPPAHKKKQRQPAFARSLSDQLIAKKEDSDIGIGKNVGKSEEDDEWSHRQTSPTTKGKLEHQGKAHKTWMDSVVVVTDPSPDDKWASPKLIAAIHIEKKSDDATGERKAFSDQTRTTIITNQVLKRHTPFIVMCGSTQGMEPRLLPTIADIFNHDFTAGVRSRTRRKSSSPSVRPENNDAIERHRRGSLQPTSIRSFYEDEEDARVTVREPYCGNALRDSSRYFESTHAVNSLLSSSTPIW